MKVRIELVNPAKNKGGDKYVGIIEGEERPWYVYLPQTITRGKSKGAPARTGTITIEME